jgi:D-alanine-D-alanine ligase
MKNVLVVYGGGGTEHEISIVSSQYLKDVLKSQKKYNVFCVEIGKDNVWRTEDGDLCELNYNKELIVGDKRTKMDVAVPCLHGYPGETGELPAFFEVIKLPYIGCNSEVSHLCFNKVSTKLWLSALGIPNTPYIFLTSNSDEELAKIEQMRKEHGDLFVKAASQGSSVGTYPLRKNDDAKKIITEAFNYSDYVLVEKLLTGRELEVSAYEYDGEIHVSYPGEIVCPSGFYSYEEKYDKDSKTETHIKAKNLSDETVKTIQEYAKKTFKLMNLRHLSRIDFMLDGDNIYLNEPNTFPGLTPISMFPKMLEGNGHDFGKFLTQIIEKAAS